MKKMVKPILEEREGGGGREDVLCEFLFGMDINITNPSAHNAS